MRPRGSPSVSSAGVPWGSSGSLLTRNGSDAVGKCHISRREATVTIRSRVSSHLFTFAESVPVGQNCRLITNYLIVECL